MLRLRLRSVSESTSVPRPARARRSEPSPACQMLFASHPARVWTEDSIRCPVLCIPTRDVVSPLLACSTTNQALFSFVPNDQPCVGFDGVLERCGILKSKRPRPIPISVFGWSTQLHGHQPSGQTGRTNVIRATHLQGRRNRSRDQRVRVILIDPAYGCAANLCFAKLRP